MAVAARNASASVCMFMASLTSFSMTSAASSAAASRFSSPKYRARSQNRGRPIPVERCRPMILPFASSPIMS